MPLLANGINANHSVWLDAGGRHIDTAFIHGDDQQKSIGEAIRRSNINRGDLFVTTKVACCPTLRCNKFCTDTGDVSAYDPAAQLNHSIELLGLECPLLDLRIGRATATPGRRRAASSTWRCCIFPVQGSRTRCERTKCSSTRGTGV